MFAVCETPRFCACAVIDTAPFLWQCKPRVAAASLRRGCLSGPALIFGHHGAQLGADLLDRVHAQTKRATGTAREVAKVFRKTLMRSISCIVCAVK